MRLAVRLAYRASAGFRLDVAFELSLGADGRVGAIFGPSGCGKTTTLSLVAGLLRPDRGRVALDDDVLMDTDRGVELDPAARRVGLVTQDALLFPHLSVRRNLLYGHQRARGRPAPEVDAVVAALGLASLLDRAPPALSGGEQRRVSLARAVLAGPRLLLLDEPFTGLDDARRYEALELVERVTAAFDLPALLVSHRADEVLRLAGSVVRLDQGRVVSVGPPSASELAQDTGGAVPNLVRLEVVPDDPRLARLPDGTALRLPRAVEQGGTVWCRLSSGAVTLESDTPETPRSSARNRLTGAVVDLDRTVPGRVRVVVDVGVALQVDVTPEAVAALELAPGARVTCVVKAHALELLG